MFGDQTARWLVRAGGLLCLKLEIMIWRYASGCSELIPDSFPFYGSGMILFETRRGAFSYSAADERHSDGASVIPSLVNQVPGGKEVHGETTNPHR
jgi:hypothetical protein